MRRDRLTFGMIIGIPLIQLILFGFAINADPKNLPTAILSADQSIFTRSLIQAMVNTSYFKIEHIVSSEDELSQLISQGDVQFALHIPTGFSRDLLRHEQPDLLLEVDATDPGATSYAISALNLLLAEVWQRDLQEVTPPAPNLILNHPANLIIHRHYNPENITQYNIVPGLIGVVLTMTMVLITSLAIARERERGTMENLLATPLLPLEVMVGKIIPYILVGYIQTTLILLAARFIFKVPFVGSIPLLLVVMLVFIAANLAVGITFSTLAQNQLQAMQMSFFFFLPSILLSGFMFPFRGMPIWAQTIAQVLPLTHFLRIIRGILLKGNGLEMILPEIWPIALFMFFALIIALKRYRQTLD